MGPQEKNLLTGIIFSERAQNEFATFGEKRCFVAKHYRNSNNVSLLLLVKDDVGRV